MNLVRDLVMVALGIARDESITIHVMAESDQHFFVIILTMVGSIKFFFIPATIICKQK